MASARYTLNIKPEDLQQEAAPELTAAEKRANWLHYNKWLLIGLTALAIFVGIFIHDISTNVEADYSIAIVTASSLDDEALTSLEEALTPFFDDANGDGQVAIDVVHYMKNYDDPSLTKDLDANVTMAGDMQLMADLSTAVSQIFITDSFTGMQDATNAFVFWDDPYHVLEESELGDYARMGYKWGDSPLLSSLELHGVCHAPGRPNIDPQQLLADMVIGMCRVAPDAKKDVFHRFYTVSQFLTQAAPTE